MLRFGETACVAVHAHDCHSPDSDSQLSSGPNMDIDREGKPVVGWMINLAYLMLLAMASPLLIYRALRHGKYRTGWRQKLWGRLPMRSSQRTCIWLHAVSVGEVLLLRTVIDGLRRRLPDAEIWLSTTTHTGHGVARQKCPDCRIVYFPLDFTWAVRNALARVRPDLIALAELELWPNFVRQAHALGVPLVLINGRISERSFRGYRWIRSVMRPTLRRFARLGVQTEEYRQRLMQLGACGQRTVVTGSVKFDGVEADRDNPRTRGLRAALGIAPGDRVLVAGSTHAPEEQLVLQSYCQLRSEFPDLRLVLAPRHLERFDESDALVRAAGLPLARRSNRRHAHKGSVADQRPVLLLDTLGELADCWGLADVAFVGGSLSRRGGQNMLEPCAYGAAVLLGPNTWNFRHAVELLRSRSAVSIVHDGTGMTREVRRLLHDDLDARRMGQAARELVQSQQGATERTLDLLCQALGLTSESASHRAA
jgi:3-deoxy-D-manno-octulosonic-acid transferase